MEAGKLIYLGKFREAAEEVEKTITSLTANSELRLKFSYTSNIESLEQEFKILALKVKNAMASVETQIKVSQEEVLNTVKEIINDSQINWLKQDESFNEQNAKEKMYDSAKDHLIQLEVDQYNLVCNTIILNSIKK